MKKLFLIMAVGLLLGAGCASSEPVIPEDATPGVNEENCVKSGGAVGDNACDCPEGFFEDPAGFCIDLQGKPGGSMRP
ncbi:MAG: hypothetical protein QY323_03430 [Patescibacteria group bacterium]|nr:MAG: hypothetical protein QY323_03430 [Patescibacteria group bacterium]